MPGIGATGRLPLAMIAIITIAIARQAHTALPHLCDYFEFLIAGFQLGMRTAIRLLQSARLIVERTSPLIIRPA